MSTLGRTLRLLVVTFSSGLFVSGLLGFPDELSALSSAREADGVSVQDDGDLQVATVLGLGSYIAFIDEVTYGRGLQAGDVIVAGDGLDDNPTAQSVSRRLSSARNGDAFNVSVWRQSKHASKPYEIRVTVEISRQCDPTVDYC